MSDQVKNVVLVGQGGVGKTMLAEAMLHLTGRTTRLGGHAGTKPTLDYDEQEGARVLQELIDALRIELERTVVIPDMKQHAATYVLDLITGVYWEIYHENTRPYTCGWMEMSFGLQSVIREDVQRLI